MTYRHDEVAKRSAAIEEELRRNGWTGLAWAALRRSVRYKRAWAKYNVGKLPGECICARFRIEQPKSPDEVFAQGDPPRFILARVFPANMGKRVPGSGRMRRLSVLLAKDEILVVLRANQPFNIQLEAMKAAIERGQGKASRQAASSRLRAFGRTLKLLAPALLALELGQEGMGPSEIGRILFPSLARDAAKTKARDLTHRGYNFAAHGYLHAAYRAEESTSASRPAAGSKPSQTERIESLIIRAW